ncbi:hypothetical protein [Kineosporia succinea]|uniref:Integral membrane protein n=1 Tax=Kineosporia succinea TaxID=84632 RepID=A0ABT9P8M3_9ACTN|nr:hypothetical protein [Kineosporia succinea]MDP9828812.1 hypothetical protein [Kineosporia succinea]
MLSSFVTLVAAALAGHAAWILVRNPKDWPSWQRNAYAFGVLAAATGATLWSWGWRSGNTRVAGLIGGVLGVLGCLAASFVARRKD